MPAFLHLEENPQIRAAVARVFEGTGHELVQCETVEEAHRKSKDRQFDLYLCGALGKYSDGLIFAVEMHALGRGVVAVGQKRKFSRIPFLSTGELQDRASVLVFLEEIVAEGS